MERPEPIWLSSIMDLLEIIRKRGSKWCLFSKDGSRSLGCYDSKNGAENRERQVQYFKYRDAMQMNNPHQLLIDAMKRKLLREIHGDTLVQEYGVPGQKWGQKKGREGGKGGGGSLGPRSFTSGGVSCCLF